MTDPFLARPMRDEAHGAACKLRLNQPISNLTTCYCGESLERDPWHILSHKGGGEAGRRHDEIVDRLVDAVQRAGDKLGPSLVKTSGKTVDVLIFLQFLAQKVITSTFE